MLLCCALVAGCGRRTPKGELAPDATATRDVSPSTPARSGPPTAESSDATAPEASVLGQIPQNVRPQLTVDTSGSVREWGIEAAGLPALSEDGQRVLYVIDEGDGVRGLANHTVFIKRVSSDARERWLPIFSASELGDADQKGNLDVVRKSVDRNVTTVQRVLTGERWVPLETAGGQLGGAFTTADGLTVEFSNQHLIVKDKSGSTRLDYDGGHWAARPRELSTRTASGSRVVLQCSFTPALEHVHVATAQKVLAATVVQVVTGNDACEASPETHVLTWK